MSNALFGGIDLGGTRIRAVLADGRGNLLDRQEVRTHADEGPNAVIKRIVGLAERTFGQTPGVCAVGVGAPGPLNARTGVVTNPPNLPGWVNVPLGTLLQERLGIPTFLGNDGNAAAVGELTFGAGRGTQDLIYITVSTGVGGGIVMGGKLVDGYNGAGGEIGHMVLYPNGELCSCGRAGHLEAYASGPAIARQAVEALNSGERSGIPTLAEGSPNGITARLVVQAAAGGDALGLRLVRQAGERLGHAAVTLIHLLNPELIIVGGGVSAAGELLLEPMRAVASQGLMPVFHEGLSIVRAELGADVGLYGAVALAARGLASGGRAEGAVPSGG